MHKTTLLCLVGLSLVCICGCHSSLEFVTDLGADPGSPEQAAAPVPAEERPTDSSVSAAPAPDPADTAADGNPMTTMQVIAAAQPPMTVDDSNESAPAALSHATVPEKNRQAKLDEALTFCDISQEFWQKGELENALQALDQAYALILEVTDDDQPKLIQQKEDLRFLISKRILEIYASRNIVVNGHHNEIPLELNKYVQKEIDHFTTGRERQFFIDSYVRSGRYRNAILPVLREAGLPEELSWLPLIESGFKVRALSRARALGLWQFIPSTGYKFGLKRDKYVDERLDPPKATRAAVAYLKELHQIFGDWTTVLAAYNCGEGRVLRVIREQNLNYLDNFWDLYQRLPYETARYVPRFLATLHIVNNLEKYGFDSLTPDPPLVFETVSINKQVHLKSVAKQLDLASERLVELNPELRYQIVPPRTYDLKVPPGSESTLIAQLDDIPISSLPRPSYVYHRIRRGETLSIIARRYRTSVRRIMRANRLRSSHYIVAGRLLKIPQRGYNYRSSNARRSASTIPSVHTVARGDSLWIIAKRYGTTTRKIQELNGLRSTDLHIGQKLKIPNGTAAAKNGKRAYHVRRGDSPYTIARKHDMPLQKFLKINEMSSRTRIYPGQIVYVE